MLDVNFLKEKLYYRESDGRLQHSSSGNIYILSDTVVKFTQYNFLPFDRDDILDGHFTIFVNIKTFEYLVYKSSDYGGFTYTIACDFHGFYTIGTLPIISKKRIESIIAYKLLGAYFYDRTSPNSKGANLFPNDENGSGHKVSLLCDYRAFKWVDSVQTYSNVELQALKILSNWEQPNEKIKNAVKNRIIRKISQCKIGECVTVKFDDYTIIFDLREYEYIIKLKRGERTISRDVRVRINIEEKIRDFVDGIEVMINNYAI